MSEDTIVKDQDLIKPDEVEQSSEVSRRSFLHYTIAATSGLALTSMLPAFVNKVWAQQTPIPCPPGDQLQTIMEIQSSAATKTLQAILKVLDEPRTYLGPPSNGVAGMCNKETGQMRYVAGYDPATVTAGLKELGAEIISAADESQDRARFRDLDLLRFKDPNGVVVELRGRLA